jgi:hypothetical protein
LILAQSGADIRQRKFTRDGCAFKGRCAAYPYEVVSSIVNRGLLRVSGAAISRADL